MDKIPYANILSEQSGEFLRWPGDIMHEYGHLISALLYSRLFMPSFLEVDGSILLDKDRLGMAAAFLKGKAGGEFLLAKLGASFNTIEPYYLFSDRDHYSEAIEVKLTNAIAESLRAWLKYRY